MNDLQESSQDPSLNRLDGRNERGQYVTGNKGGPGNPLARRCNQLRAAALEAVTGPDIQRILKAMVECAIGGDVAAAKLVLSYTLGAPINVDAEERVASLEALVAQRPALFMAIQTK